MYPAVYKLPSGEVPVVNLPESYWIPPFIDEYEVSYEGTETSTRRPITYKLTANHTKNVNLIPRPLEDFRIHRIVITVLTLEDPFMCMEWQCRRTNVLQSYQQFLRFFSDQGLAPTVTCLRKELPAWEALIWAQTTSIFSLRSSPLMVEKDVITCGTFRVALMDVLGVVNHKENVTLYLRDGRDVTLFCQDVESSFNKINFHLKDPHHRVRVLQVASKVMLKHAMPTEIIELILNLAYTTPTPNTDARRKPPMPA